jgi:hypothetical protein
MIHIHPTLCIQTVTPDQTPPPTIHSQTQVLQYYLIALYSIIGYSALCTVYCVLCTVYCVLCTVYCVLCTVYCVLCTVYYVLCTVYCCSAVCVYVYFVRCVLCTTYNTIPYSNYSYRLYRLYTIIHHAYSNTLLSHFCTL